MLATMKFEYPAAVHKLFFFCLYIFAPSLLLFVSSKKRFLKVIFVIIIILNLTSIVINLKEQNMLHTIPSVVEMLLV